MLLGVHARGSVSGRLFLNGLAAAFRTPRISIARGLALVTEDRKAQSLVKSLSVQFNITLAALARFRSGVVVDRSKERSAVRNGLRLCRS
jgi:ABC-type sugar transport system ATPase subunit